MSKFTPLVITVLFYASSWYACKNDGLAPQKNPEQSVADTVRPQKPATSVSGIFKISSGSVDWVGRKFSGDFHTGKINIAEGTLNVTNGYLTSGQATIDMHTISITDQSSENEKEKLITHLKSADFFDVKKYPMATCAFTEIYPSNLPDFNAVVPCSLTLKGKTKTINVPVKLIISDTHLSAVSTAFPINRTEFAMTYRSGILNTVKDLLISDVVTLNLSLEATKQ
jgi:polyisoprenoid-binding protein YceI